MPSASRDDFIAAARRVGATAPAGTSREAYYKLVNQDLASQGLTAPASQETASTDQASEGAERVMRNFGLRSSKLVTETGEPVQTETSDAPWMRDLKAALEPAAHPQTVGDFGALLVPSEGALVQGARAMARFPVTAKSIIGRVLQGAGKAGEIAGNTLPPIAKPHILTMATEGFQNVGKAMQEPRFTDLPLYKQMEQLPELPRPVGVGRTQIPPLPPRPPVPAAAAGKALPKPPSSPLDYLTGTAMVDATPAERMLLAKQRAGLRAMAPAAVLSPQQAIRVKVLMQGGLSEAEAAQAVTRR